MMVPGLVFTRAIEAVAAAIAAARSSAVGDRRVCCPCVTGTPACAGAEASSAALPFGMTPPDVVLGPPLCVEGSEPSAPGPMSGPEAGAEEAMAVVVGVGVTSDAASASMPVCISLIAASLSRSACLKARREGGPASSEEPSLSLLSSARCSVMPLEAPV